VKTHVDPGCLNPGYSNTIKRMASKAAVYKAGRYCLGDTPSIGLSRTEVVSISFWVIILSSFIAGL